MGALSPLWRARGLRALSLRDTGLTRICRDWRTELEWLTDLDLSNNNVSVLDFDNLQWRRRKATFVNLRGNPLRGIHYTRGQFAAVLAGNVSSDFASSPVRTSHFSRLQSSKRSHALRCGARAALRGTGCLLRPDTYVLLEEVDPRALQCTLPPDAGCPAGCMCRFISEYSELSCERAGLTSVPSAPPGLPARALLLPYNNISVLTIKDITPDLEVLDLSDNLIASVDAATMAALLDSRRIVCLAGNPLRCDALPPMRTLLAHVAPKVGGVDGTRYTCRGGGDAFSIARELGQRCEPTVWPFVLAALVLATASAVLAGCLVRPATRQCFQVSPLPSRCLRPSPASRSSLTCRSPQRFLFERGLCLHWLLQPLRAGDDAELPYDAFVSFSHRDASFAMELVRRLERGAALRLCLHERDWRPGEWIPAQITRSVRESRRTLVLLSENFLSSTWARAELREGYVMALCEQRPRLLLVLLPGMTPERAAAADPELRAYIASVTYLRWDDPHFWEKLLLVMPRPRAPSAPGTPDATTGPGSLVPPAEPKPPACA
ncbi:unnamed protein product [Euphydryas editha]|uniref:TIR domain-containing protein n=1 Tax=Euphydryas editha TaxID=104508 RepID=A0AAU9UYQ9_EUPED|nr:unnamed protein product [Euphydryas editha]